MLADNILCVLEEDSEGTFFGFLREEDAGNGSPKCQNTPMNATTSSSYLQSYVQSWGPGLVLDWFHNGRGNPILQESESHWGKGGNRYRLKAKGRTAAQAGMWEVILA